MRAAALLCVGVLAACNSNVPAPKTHHVEIRAMQYVPAELTVAVGDTIVWTNSDVLPHTVTSTAPSVARFDSQNIESKRQWGLTVEAAGDHSYLCTYHPTMRAKVTVVPKH